MKEFSTPFQEGLNKGLRPDAKMPRNMQYLDEAYNVKIGRVGNQPYVPLSEAINADVDARMTAKTYPFGPVGGTYEMVQDILGTGLPKKYAYGHQLFQTRNGLYVATPERIIFYDADTGPIIIIQPTLTLPAGTGYIGSDPIIQTVPIPSWSTLNRQNWQLADFTQTKIWLDCENSLLYQEVIDSVIGAHGGLLNAKLIQWWATDNFVPPPVGIGGGGPTTFYRYTMYPRAICGHNNTLFISFKCMYRELYDLNPYDPASFDPGDGHYLGVLTSPSKWYARFQNILVALQPGRESTDVAAMFTAGCNNVLSGLGTSVLNIKSFSGISTTHMSWNGMIDHIKPLGNDIVVYGSRYIPMSEILVNYDNYGEDQHYQYDIGGISLMSIKVVEKAVGWGETVISKVGVPRGRPVAGNLYKHLYADMNGVLWLLELGGKPTRLGYEEYIKPLMTNLTGEDMLFISYDEREDEFYISSGYASGYANTTYLLSKNGLSKVYQAVMSIAQYTTKVGSVYPVTTECSIGQNDTDVTGFICTSKMDMGMRAIKTITGLEVGAQNGAAMVANVDYKYNTADAFVASVPKPVHKSGIVTPMVAGTDFRVRVKSTSYVDFDIDYLGIRWKVNDKRLIRGLHESTSSKAVPSSGS